MCKNNNWVKILGLEIETKDFFSVPENIGKTEKKILVEGWEVK